MTGDHGEGLGDHGEQTHGLFVYESTLRVPLILGQLGGSHPPDHGVVSDDTVRHVDILPTVLDALGKPSDSTLPGRSLLNAAPDPSALTSYFEALSTSLNRGWAPLTGVIVGRDKLVELPIPELDHLANDPTEQLNLIEKNRIDGGFWKCGERSSGHRTDRPTGGG